jgi:hypothetical protein
MERCFVAHVTGEVHALHVPELGAKELPSVDCVLRRMLAKHPEDRYPDLAECKREISAALAQDDVASEVG